MKTFIRPLMLLCVAGIITINSIAQTVSIPATIGWQFNLGTAGQVATYSSGTSDYFSLNWVEAGSNLTYKGIANNFSDTLTTFQPVVSSGAADSTSTNLVSFNIRLNSGLSFKPTNISFDFGRYGTDGGLVKIAWKSPDGTITILQSNVKPNRVNATSTPPVYPTHVSYDLSAVSIPVSEGDCGLYIHIYSLGNTKTIGVGNIILTGNIISNSKLKDPTVITWDNPQPIAHGTPLSIVQLNATVAGSTGAVTYTPANGAIINAGIQTLTVNVAEDANYAAAKKTVTIQVYPEPSTITWNPPSSITYGTALNTAQFKASVTGTTGTANYIPSLDSILPAGTYPFTVLVSADDNHCATGSLTYITINKATPTITWENPANIVLGTALSATQLNATATGTTGTATYTPPLGTVLPIGTQTLTVTFSGDANYEPATKSVTINVTSTVSVETLTDANISVFPNPFTDIITIKVPKLNGIYTLTITNTAGDVILFRPIASENTELNLKDLPAGTYLLQLLSEKSKIVKHIVKQ